MTHVFADRHIGPRTAERDRMLETVGFDTLDALVDAAVPPEIRSSRPLTLPAALTEAEVLAALRERAEANTVLRPMIGQGYSGTHTPAVIRRNVVENPAWYTAYTPYQPEISQGRLDAHLTFQTVVSDLTGLPVAGSSLLDEATAVAEAVALMHRAAKGVKDGWILLDADLWPQSLDVTLTRARGLGLRVRVENLVRDGLPADVLEAGALAGVVVQQVGASGRAHDLREVVAAAKGAGALVTVATDPLAATLLVSAGELGADVAVGSAQRLGVPLYYGGPHAAYMAVREGLERTLPGRLVGVSKDDAGAPAYRLALQTREQHIRRERATSNICTAQALLAVVAAMYAVHHGPDGLRAIAAPTRAHALRLSAGLVAAGATVADGPLFDTVRVSTPGVAEQVRDAAARRGVALYAAGPDHVQAACSEVTTEADLVVVVEAVVEVLGLGIEARTALGTALAADEGTHLPAELARTSSYLEHPNFHRFRSETALVRHLRRLADKDLALDRTMIPLGSCTMKLNAAFEMEPISWPGFADLHPYAPVEHAAGYTRLIGELEGWLAEVTGYAAVSVQPNAGSQGELAGLLAIRRYHLSRGDDGRDLVLIPASAHGTNAASAALAGLGVVVVATAPDGEVDLADLRAKLEQHGPRVAAIMITYPSTHGVYEAHVREVCDLVHAAGGQVYIDGANLNALVGLARPAELGGDVSHLNLHKTFCIPHGGGGPGVGPVAVAEHLVPFLPTTAIPSPVPVGTSSESATGDEAGLLRISAAPFGSAGVLPISWAYVAAMGPDGLRSATEHAVLAANYLATRLRDAFPVLYTGPGGLVAHECILDLRPLTKATGVTAEDVAKRLVDHGFHAPTLSFPVAGTLMVEPTESEDLTELDRFVDAMLAIRGEIDAVADGRWQLADSPLRRAPHTAAAVVADEWDRPYSREQAAYPSGPVQREHKYWPPVGRIDNAWGDRNLACSCPPLEDYL